MSVPVYYYSLYDLSPVAREWRREMATQQQRDDHDNNTGIDIINIRKFHVKLRQKWRFIPYEYDMETEAIRMHRQAAWNAEKLLDEDLKRINEPRTH